MNAPVMVEVGSTTDPLEVCSRTHRIHHHAEGVYCSLQEHAASQFAGADKRSDEVDVT